ncbi:hypothetical protein V1477_018943 [Vespula maculifrons]|uniref:Uncharacterized protein n=1 Tax=Vespula maculifrons TaxID=7453 RepID=A0ABD2ATJ9_VESMC
MEGMDSSELLRWLVRFYLSTNRVRDIACIEKSYAFRAEEMNSLHTSLQDIGDLMKSRALRNKMEAMVSVCLSRDKAAEASRGSVGP